MLYKHKQRKSHLMKAMLLIFLFKALNPEKRIQSLLLRVIWQTWEWTKKKEKFESPCWFFVIFHFDFGASFSSFLNYDSNISFYTLHAYLLYIRRLCCCLSQCWMWGTFLSPKLIHFLVLIDIFIFISLPVFLLDKISSIVIL